MKKTILLFLFSTIAFSQVKGSRVGFIDMDYILEKVPNYAEAKNQLDAKAQTWKQEIEVKKIEVNKLKEELKTERHLLTKELIEEREEEINYLENQLLDYQQNKFGPTGDLVLQKAVLIKPIQDQIFTIVQDIAEQKRYDFIFDKSSDLSILFAAKNFDISDQVVRQLVRAEKSEQLTSKQLKEQQTKDALEDMQDENPELAERQKVLDEKKTAREKLADDRKAAYEARKKAADDKRQKLIEERELKKSGTLIEDDKKDKDSKVERTESAEKNSSEEKKLTPEEIRKKALDARNKTIEDRKKVADDRRKKIIQDREDAKKKREQENKTKKKE